jgi:hypothetical protein
MSVNGKINSLTDWDNYLCLMDRIIMVLLVKVTLKDKEDLSIKEGPFIKAKFDIM